MSEFSSSMHWKTKALLFVILVGITTSLRLPYYESSCNPFTEFRCDLNSWSGTFCLPISLRCNGKYECMDRSDEYGCNARVREISHCGREEFRCDNDKCYPDSWRCDGIMDCYDNTDEQKCQGTRRKTVATTPTTTTTTTTSAPKLCAKGDFMCADGERCCPNTWRCDDIIDCNDGSDEHHCRGHVPKTDKTIVMSFEDLLHRHKQEARNKRSVELSNRPRLSNGIRNNETEDSEH
ncbi:sortilin-related receptor-like isoform X3 [Mytilus trossulus]|uniref:sortilin-related receptor-like isoform X3 n=1 Tax=Mytilus trossulus TaxID=6551 RepID=UPI00300543E0